jgi:hypothetical protein
MKDDKYGTLRYVDTVKTHPGNNYLYRGGAALTIDKSGNTVFDYDGLRKAIKNVVNPPPVPPPDSYHLVVVNLVHSNEGVGITAEADFFWGDHSNPNWNKGQVQFWDTYGTSLCYFQTPLSDRDRLVETLGEWLPDPLIWRVNTLRRWLEFPSTLPIQPLPNPNQPRPEPDPFQSIVVYVHCDGGCDRTSEMIGAYRLCYPPANWAQEEIWSNMCKEHPCTAPMGCNNYMATQWYAFWLKQTKGRFIIGIGENDGGCNDAGRTWSKCSA